MPYLVGLIILSASWFLLGGETIDTHSRSLKELWDLAHIVYFFLLLYLVGYLPWLKRIPAKILIPGLLLSSLLLGGLIELSQYVTGRTPDSQDLVRNLMGVLLALVFLRPYRQLFNRKLLLSCRVVVLAMLMVLTIPFAIAVIDEITANQQFPVLINNDTPFEVGRWRGNASIETDRIESTNLFKIILSPDKQYPGASLRYFPGDWSGYNQLVMRFYNPSSEPLNIIVRVHDRAHETSHFYQDRFNLNTRVKPGWSDILIELGQIESAPRNRKMNMRKISDLSFFSSGLDEEKIVYIDRVYLSQNTDKATGE